MRTVLTCLLLICLGFIIPWTNGYYTIISWILSFSGIIYLSLFIVDRFYIGDKEGFRIDIENPKKLNAAEPIEKKNPPPVVATAPTPEMIEAMQSTETEEDNEPFVPFEIDLDAKPPPKK
ncbi:MAG: hypothetical protein K0U15_04160 [Proteobacteria bacterium]|nr:hypothetical protein [Pseudomonadota bacterium]MCH9758197.1 hypothetical protein [Pseudomonadota bacterium]